jgi:hypothetical protein
LGTRPDTQGPPAAACVGDALIAADYAKRPGGRPADRARCESTHAHPNAEPRLRLFVCLLSLTAACAVDATHPSRIRRSPSSVHPSRSERCYPLAHRGPLSRVSALVRAVPCRAAGGIGRGAACGGAVCGAWLLHRRIRARLARRQRPVQKARTHPRCSAASGADSARWRVSQGRAQPRNKQCNEHGWHTSPHRTMRQCRTATAMAALMQQRSNAVAHFGRLGGSAA